MRQILEVDIRIRRMQIFTSFITSLDLTNNNFSELSEEHCLAEVNLTHLGIHVTVSLIIIIPFECRVQSFHDVKDGALNPGSKPQWVQHSRNEHWFSWHHGSLHDLLYLYLSNKPSYTSRIILLLLFRTHTVAVRCKSHVFSVTSCCHTSHAIQN